jgi:hypothetical protein
LTWRIGLAPVAAREKVRVARALGELPRIDAAFAGGRLSYSQVRAVTRIATAANEGAILEVALVATGRSWSASVGDIARPPTIDRLEQRLVGRRRRS